MKILFPIVTLLIPLQLFANNDLYNSAYQEGRQLAEQHKHQSSEATRNFNPHELPNFTNNPDASKHYGGVKQEKDNLSAVANAEMTKSEQGKAVSDSFRVRPVYKIDKNSAGMQKSQLIIENAQDIARGISNPKVDCKKASRQTCTTEYMQEVCTEANHVQKQSCTKNLIVEVIQQPIDSTLDVTASAKNNWFRKGVNITIDMNTGGVIKTDATRRSVNLSPNLSEFPCGEIQYLGSESPTRAKVTIQAHPNCANNKQLTINISGKASKKRVGGRVIVHYRTTKKVIANEYWQNGCLSFERLVEQKMCSHEGQETCTKGKETRDINGIPITRDCWEKANNYNCNKAPFEDTCSPLRTKGCEQIGSDCKTKIDDVCAVHQQTYRCPIKKCTAVEGIVCGDEKTFCMDGNCAPQTYEPSKDFEKGVSALSALGAAQKDFDEHFIFKGQTAKCDDIIFGFLNCCQDKGWGQDIGLAKCSKEEKQLGHAKQKRLTISIGRYCSKKVLGVCVKHKKSYCMMQSKLARIVQEQGRRGQLKIGFGSPKHPVCRGLTPEELQRIDFSQIDFGEFYEDIYKNMKAPDIDKTTKRISDRIRDSYGAGKGGL